MGMQINGCYWQFHWTTKYSRKWRIKLQKLQSYFEEAQRVHIYFKHSTGTCQSMLQNCITHPYVLSLVEALPNFTVWNIPHPHSSPKWCPLKMSHFFYTVSLSTTLMVKAPLFYISINYRNFLLETSPKPNCSNFSRELQLWVWTMYGSQSIRFKGGEV